MFLLLLLHPSYFRCQANSVQRHMRQGSVPPNPNAMGAQPGAHFRRESSHSIQGENPGAANRSNFPQGGRGRGGYGPHNNAYNNQMGYPPNGQLRHTGQGRGMPQQHGQQPRNMPYPNSPQPNRSPAMLASMPNTPNMPPANMQPNMSMQTPPTYHYAPPLGPTQQVQCPPLVVSGKFHFKPPHKRNKNRREHHDGAASTYHEEHACGLSGRELSQSSRCRNRSAEQAQPDNDKTSTRASSLGMHRSASQTQTLLHLSSNHHTNFNLSPETGNYESLLTLKNQNFGYPPQQMDQFGRPAMPMQYAYGNMPYMPPPQPNSPGFGQHYGAPYPQSSHNMSRTPSQHDRPSSASQPNQPVVVASTPQQQIAQPKAGSNDFVKPKRSAAIQIKNEQGEVVDPTQFKQPASPAPSNQPTKAPPVVASTPTPPPKPATPSHTRTESQAPAKTAKEIQDELKEKIRQATQADSEEKTKPSQPEEAKPSQPEEAKPSHPEATKVDSDKKDSDKKSPAEPIVPAIVPPETEVAPEPAAVSEDSTPKVEADKPAASEDTAKPQETEEDEMERVIREMEEADARREKEEEEHRVKREAEKAEAKKKDEENRKGNAADADAKLREQEREMERLEEEKERRREEADSTGKALSVADALAKAKGGDVKTGESPKVDAVADKLADMNIQEDKSDSAAEQKPSTAEKRAAKPAALNLAPLNTKPVEPPQPSAALQSLKSARFLQVMGNDIYPEGIKSPNPALNAAVTKKGKTFKYDAQFLLQFQKVFTEQPSLEFHQQVKTLIGDGDGNRSAKAQTPGSARQGSRGQAFTGGMGTFNAPAPQGRTIPPGTTSEQRFAASTGTQPSRPQVAPMASFQRPGGAFPSSASMTRGGSQSGMGNLPNSPRQPSRSTRGGSRRDYNSGAKEAQAAKTMPLTAGQDLKPIMVSASGWKASSLGTRGVATPGATPGGYLDPEVVQRKVKAALNKMTPEKFDKISDQILEISSQSKEESDGRTLRQVIQLTFEKATDEAHWASMYAKFCKRMLDTMSDDIRDESIKDRAGAVVSGGALFRKYLLNRCQEEFERGWALDLPEQPEAAEEEGNKKPGEAVMLSDEYYLAAAAKRKGLGLVQFIGELFKLGMLTERIMHECVRKLVDYKGVPDEAEVESLTKLLRTVGANLDSTEKGRPMMDMYFQRIDSMMRMDDLPSRLKFMLLDLLDLRRANWVSKEGNKGPKTLEEVRADVSFSAVLRRTWTVRSANHFVTGRSCSSRKGSGGSQELPERWRPTLWWPRRHPQLLCWVHSSAY